MNMKLSPSFLDFIVDKTEPLPRITRLPPPLQFGNLSSAEQQSPNLGCYYRGDEGDGLVPIFTDLFVK